MRFYGKTGIKKFYVFDFFNLYRLISFFAHNIKKHRVEDLIGVEHEHDSLFRTFRPVNVRHVLVQSIEVVNYDRIKIFENFDNIIIFETLTY